MFRFDKLIQKTYNHRFEKFVKWTIYLCRRSQWRNVTRVYTKHFSSCKNNRFVMPVSRRPSSSHLAISQRHRTTLIPSLILASWHWKDLIGEIPTSRILTDQYPQERSPTYFLAKRTLFAGYPTSRRTSVYNLTRLFVYLLSIAYCLKQFEFNFSDSNIRIYCRNDVEFFISNIEFQNYYLTKNDC